MTHDIVTRINRETSLTAMAHLTCAAHTRAELEEIVTRYRDEGVDNILALGGDPPKELNLPPGELRARDRSRRRSFATSATFPSGLRSIPKVIPRRRSRTTDRRRQAEKLTLADFGALAVLLRPEVWFEFLDELRELGVTTRVIPGIMPVLNVKSVKRMAEMSGAEFPRWLEDRLRAVEDDEDAMRAVGIEAATELCRELMAGGVRLVPLLHAQSVARDPRDLRKPRSGCVLKRHQLPAGFRAPGARFPANCWWDSAQPPNTGGT